MQLIFILIICFITVSIIAIAVIRTDLKHKSQELTEQINQITSYSELLSRNKTRERLSSLNENLFTNISTDLNYVFDGKLITASQEKDFTDYYQAYFQEAHSLLVKLKTFKITPSETISNFIDNYEAINKLVKQHNEEVITLLLDKHKDFFDHCLKYPLDKQQRRSIISEEANCLVVSSAGSGKTSSIFGKVKYLTEVKGVAPHRILLISYTNKAAAELTERMATDV